MRSLVLSMRGLRLGGVIIRLWLGVANKMLKMIWGKLIRRETYGNVNGERYEIKLNEIGIKT